MNKIYLVYTRHTRGAISALRCVQIPRFVCAHKAELINRSEKRKDLMYARYGACVVFGGERAKCVLTTFFTIIYITALGYTIFILQNTHAYISAEFYIFLEYIILT